MKLHKNYRRCSIVAVLSTGLLLTACGGSSAPPQTQTTPTATTYEVTVVNATNNQPLSPVVVASHAGSYSAWSVGSPASTGIEYIAEDGSNSQFRDSLTGIDATSVSGAGAIFPGTSQTMTITTGTSTQTHITIATMLINTNDAFAGINALDVSKMVRGESVTLNAKVYDAGTELNSESAGTMPGPADGGEGFNPARSDINDVVRGHGGVVTAADGLNTSVLDQSHRFDNPGMIITITRK